MNFARAKNPSWISSVRLALEIGIVWAPTRLQTSISAPLLAMVASAALVFLGIAMFAIETLLVLFVGLLGRVTEADINYLLRATD